jgi:site-specific DNA-methyltransferase (adenine-specific)
MELKIDTVYNCDFCQPIVGDNDKQLIEEVLPLLYDVMKDDTPLYLFCNADHVDFFKSECDKYFTFKNLIVWDKMAHTAGDLQAQYGKQYEFILYANKGRSCFVENAFRYSDIWRIPRITGKTQLHQNQKPIDLILRILRQHTKAGDLVLDAFMGSFTTAVACHKLGRHFIGAEIDKGYYEIGCKRLADEQAQMSIFDLENYQGD